MYNVSISKDSVSGPWTRMYDTQYTVRDALLYDIICINLNQTLTTYWNLRVKFLIYYYVYMLVYFSFDCKPVHQTNILLTHCKGRILHRNKKIMHIIIVNKYVSTQLKLSALHAYASCWYCLSYEEKKPKKWYIADRIFLSKAHNAFRKKCVYFCLKFLVSHTSFFFFHFYLYFFSLTISNRVYFS